MTRSTHSCRHRHQGLRALAAATVLALAAAPPAAAGALDDLVDGYAAASSGWLDVLVPAATRTFGILAGLEIAVGALLWVIHHKSVDEMLLGFIRKILVLGLFYAFLSKFRLWLPYIIRGFEAAGQTAAHTQDLSPSAVMRIGVDLAVRMMQALSDSSPLFLPPMILLPQLIVLVVLVAFVCIAAQLILTLVEAYLVVSGGVIFLGFAAFRASAPLADKYIVYAVQVGVKLFLLYLLVGTGMTITAHWADELLRASSQGAFSWRPLFDVLAGSIVFALLVWRVPTQASHFLTQNVHVHLREALSD